MKIAESIHTEVHLSKLRKVLLNFSEYLPKSSLIQPSSPAKGHELATQKEAWLAILNF